MDNEQKCPFSVKAHSGRSNQDWWPNQLKLKLLHQNPPAGDPMGAGFNYAEAFRTPSMIRTSTTFQSVWASQA